MRRGGQVCFDEINSVNNNISLLVRFIRLGPFICLILSPIDFFFEGRQILGLIYDPDKDVVVVEIDLAVHVEVYFLEVLLVELLRCLDVLRIEVAIDQNRKILDLNYPILILISIEKDSPEAHLNIAILIFSRILHH